MWQKLIEWSKTILLSRAMMPRILSAIRRENEKMLSLGYGSRHFEMGMNTYDFLDRMLALNVRYRNLRELGEVVDRILDEMDEEENRILRERFFEQKAVADVMPHANIRTAYRRYNTAMEHFVRGLIDYGYDLESLESMLMADRIISAIHTRVINHAIVYRSDKSQDEDIINRDVLRPHEGIGTAPIIHSESRDERIRA